MISVVSAEPVKSKTGRQEDYDYYLAQMRINRQENYLESTIRKFRSFPHLDKAYRLIDSRRFSDARQEFQQYLEIDPLDLKARMAYIDLLYQLKEYREVIQQSNLALKQRPDLVPAMLYRALARNVLGNREAALADFSAIHNNKAARLKDKRFALNMSIIILIEDKRYQEALSLMDQIPDKLRDFGFFMRYAIAKEGINDLDGAWLNYQNALNAASSDDETVQAYTALGVIFQKMHKPEKARGTYQLALNLDPDNTGTLRSLAYLYYDSNQLSKAINMMEKVLKQKFTDSDQEFLANLYFADQDYLSAARSYEKLLWKQTKKKDLYRVYMLLGYAYSKANRPALAIEAFRHASEIKQSSETLHSLAYALETNGDFEQAIKIYRILINQHPSPETLITLSNLYVDVGDNDKAVEALKSALEFDLSDSQKRDVHRSYMLIGYAYSKANQQAKAVEAFRQASTLAETDRSLTSLAYALQKKGDVEKAIEIYRDLLRKKETPEMLIKLSNLYVSAGDKENAIHSLDSALKAGARGEQQNAVYRSQGELFYQKKQYEKARKAFQSAVKIDPSDPEILNSLALTNIKLGRLKEAAENLKQSLTIKESTNTLFILAEVEKSLNNQDVPIQIYRHLIKLRGLNPEQKAQALTNLGLLYLDRKQEQLAVGYLRAAIAKDKSNWKLSRNLGIGLLHFKHWQQALEQFETALNMHKSAENLLNVARAYNRTGKSDIAKKYYESALAFAEQHPGDEGSVKHVLDELGYYYAELKQNDKAIETWKQSLLLEDDPLIQMRLAMLQHSIGDDQLSLSKLESINGNQLTAEQNAERYDFIASIYAGNEQYPKAVEAQMNALALQETAKRHYALGTYLQSNKQKKKALGHLKTAVEQAPENENYKKALAYAYSQAEQYEQSAELLESVVEKEPENLGLHKDLAYLKLRSSENDVAEYWFKQAIDVRLAQLDDIQLDVAENDDEIASLRREVRELNNNFSFTAYSSYRQNNNTENSTGAPGNLGGVIPSQGGVEVSYRPPVIGLRDGRTLTLFSRMLWSMEPDSFKVDPDTFQATVGISYKPLKSQNFYISTEKLFKVGKNAQNNWLIRGLYGWTNGFDLNFGKQYWNYTTVFGDLGYFVQSPDILSFYGEARQGISYNLGNSLVLTPHAVIDGRIQTPDETNVSYMEAGGGLSVKYFFNQTRYKAPRSYLELLFQYKAGIINIDSGLTATGILRY